jgi:hypothetical protein
LYTDESPGLKVDPFVVMVLSIGFIISVVALHSMAYAPIQPHTVANVQQSLRSLRNGSLHSAMGHWKGDRTAWRSSSMCESKRRATWVPKVYFYEAGIAGRGKMVLAVYGDMHVSSEISIGYALGLIDLLSYHAHRGSFGTRKPLLFASSAYAVSFGLLSSALNSCGLI